jgi:hypothetical protein
MDLSTFITDKVSSGNTLLFEPKYINVEYVFYQIYLFLNKYFGVGGERVLTDGGTVASSFAETSNQVSRAGEFLKTILYIFILFAFTMIAYMFWRLLEIRKREHDYMHHETHEYYHKRAHKEHKVEEVYKSKNPRWQAVVDYMNSHNEGDFKLAVLEADSMLDSLLDNLGFKGEGIGEKLKSIDPDKFPKLNNVWEAHNIRNRIAHEGVNFNLSIHEAKRVIAIYEQVFRDYNFI